MKRLQQERLQTLKDEDFELDGSLGKLVRAKEPAQGKARVTGRSVGERLTLPAT